MFDTNRREFMKCLAWAGTGVVWTLTGGVPVSSALAKAVLRPSDFHFVQISDTHIGFDKDANPDTTATAREAIARVNALPVRPELVLHTGDLTHAQKPGAFDTVAGLLQELNTGATYTVPGEHDVFEDGGKEYLARFGRGTTGDGWRSFDSHGVHFVGLVNVLSFKSGGVGTLGAEQLAWLAKDLESLSDSTPIVVYAHIPLWAVYPDWGWVTNDGEQALTRLRRFGSVTVLNGHIHQVLQKVEGHVTFHTAYSTAYPQPAPGTAPGPGPLRLPAGELRSHLGLREVSFRASDGALAVTESKLG
jgi:3',5'-cyclic AMP phosphodiesterase CpdA